ncbi:hypothetical protein AAHA48_15350 [Dickeya oryzae]|uniref:hypothetical protein n=1 Tax=Dickeya oryzae TaxID=1240404 RepID=UPI0031694D8F
MKAILLMITLSFPLLSWGNQQIPKTQEKEMAEAVCLYQYELIHTRFTLGLSEETAIKASSNILKEYLEKKKRTMNDYVFSLLSKRATEQLREIEVNPDAAQQLKSPPLDFKEKFLSSCIDRKTKQLESMNVFS